MSKFDVIIPDALRPFYETLHFAPAVKLDGRLYCSGMLGLGPDGKPVPDPEGQFVQVFESLQALLALDGATFADVLDVTSYHVDFSRHLPVFAAVKDRYVPAPYPAWTAVGVAELALPGALVEVKITARSGG